MHIILQLHKANGDKTVSFLFEEFLVLFQIILKLKLGKNVFFEIIQENEWLQEDAKYLKHQY